MTPRVARTNNAMQMYASMSSNAYKSCRGPVTQRLCVSLWTMFFPQVSLLHRQVSVHHSPLLTHWDLWLLHPLHKADRGAASCVVQSISRSPYSSIAIWDHPVWPTPGYCKVLLTNLRPDNLYWNCVLRNPHRVIMLCSSYWQQSLRRPQNPHRAFEDTL